MKNFLMTESEKSRILGMHYNAMGKTLVNEQSEAGLGKHLPENLHVAYLNVTNTKDPFALRISTPPYELTPARIKNKSYDVDFTVDNLDKTKTKRYFYQCIDSEPNQKERNFKAGQIFDSSDRISNVASVLDSTGGPWREMFSWACKPAMAVLAARKAKEQPQAQVAGAKTMAPNPVSDADVAARQKREAETKAKKEQANIDLKTLMDSPSGFLRTNDSDGYLITDKTTLDAQVKELDRVLSAGGIPTGAGQPVQDLLISMSNLVKRFPEYGQVLKSHIYNLKQ